MLVLVVSECLRGAWPRTRRIIDRYLERVGERTWRGRLTEAGLADLRRELTAVASRHSSIAASVAVGHRRFELEWIVGSSLPFGPDGQRNTYAGHAYDRYFRRRPPTAPRLQALSLALELAGLWHDVGKANAEFQAKLAGDGKTADTVRHEILSALAFLLVVSGVRPDSGRDQVESALRQSVGQPFVFRSPGQPLDLTPPGLPMPLRLVSWLIATHHRLPDAVMDGRAIADEGLFLLAEHAAAHKLTAPVSLALDPRVVTTRLIDGTHRLVGQLLRPEMADALDDWRATTAHARLALILADRWVSRQGFDPIWHGQRRPTPGDLLANRRTAPGLPGIDPDTSEQSRPHQSLDEHLAKVAAAAPVALSDVLDLQAEGAALASDGLPISLRGRSSGRFQWQNAAVAAVREGRRAAAGFFGEVIAGTGSGKTRACPKILAAAGGSLRYTLCLPLRSLTLQAGSDYRDDLGLNDCEVATVIGSAALRDLYDHRHGEKDGSENAVSLAGLLTTDRRDRASRRVRLPPSLVKHVGEDASAAAFLASPVVVATIDQIMAVADARRTSYVLAALRLASADLVLDEIDSYEADDLVAVGRLVHLAGVFGRKVLIASATLLNAQAEGLYRAYAAGYAAYARLHGLPDAIDAAVFTDGDSGSLCFAAEQGESYREQRLRLRQELASALERAPAIRRGCILPRLPVGDLDACFRQVLDAALLAHQHRHVSERRTGKAVSAILVRFAHVAACAAFARWLVGRTPPEFSLKALVYHAGFPLAVRDKVEGFLDQVLKRKPKDRFAEHPLIRRWLAGSSARDNILLVIATSVEEIGRDHDFDGAVVEPSSLQAIIQCAGRVDRHRLRPADQANVLILPTSLRGLLTPSGPAFTRPGVEGPAIVSPAPYRLGSPWLDEVVDERALQPITARCRLIDGVGGRMAELEQEKARDHLLGPSPYSLAGYHQPVAQAWLAGAHAARMPFRRSAPQLTVWYDPDLGGFRHFDQEDAPLAQTVRMDREFSLGSLRLLDLRPETAIEDLRADEPALSQDQRARFRHARRFLQASLTFYGDESDQDHVFAPDLGIHLVSQWPTKIE